MRRSFRRRTATTLAVYACVLVSGWIFSTPVSYFERVSVLAKGQAPSSEVNRDPLTLPNPQLPHVIVRKTTML